MANSDVSSAVTQESPLAKSFRLLQEANTRVTELEQQETRIKQKLGEARNEVVYLQREYNGQMSRSRTIDAMAKA